MKEALFQKKLKEDIIQCYLCPHYCSIKPGSRGKCGVRENIKGKLYSLNYGKIVSAAVDPIEKKPLFHFLPGTTSYSIASVGCNLSCEFCQNWEISQQPKPHNPIMGQEVQPKNIVAAALKAGCKSIAYTYTEPTIFFEYAYETAKLAEKKGLKNVFVTNGFTTKEAIDEISPYLDAANVDLKGFSEEFYAKICGSRLQPVLDAIKYYHKNGVFLEITTLIVPGHNDNIDMLTRVAKFVASIDKTIPWHISKFYPHYKMLDVPETDRETIHKAIGIGKTVGLKYIYAGNMPGDDYESTFCPKCSEKIIHRIGYRILEQKLKGKKCSKCGEEINIII